MVELIPGKTYLNINGDKYFMIGKDDHGWMIARDIKRDRLTTVGTAGVWIEYKEPVVHKRYVHWMKNKLTNNMVVPTTETPTLKWNNYINLHTQEVTYEEKL